jgi:hypothetical protein
MTPHIHPPVLAPGVTLGEHYTIEGPISSGGMGAVFAAVDRRTESRVAIKRTLAPRYAARFEIEARLLAQLDHPRIVRVLDHFEDQRANHLVMELVEGEDLRQQLHRRGRPGLPVEEVIEHALQASQALQYLHEQQVVHRDVKPANMILGDRGVVLVDFGIARELDPEATATIGIGTPGFSAPEIYTEGRASPRSDVFGLAASVWNLLTGSVPLPGSTENILGPLGLTPGLMRTLRAGLEVVPELRIPTPRAFATALGSPLGPSDGTPLERSEASTTAPRSVLEGVVRTAAGVFDAASASIALCDQRTGATRYQAAWGAGAKEIVGTTLEPGEGIAGAAITTGQAQVVADCGADPRFAKDVAGDTGYVPNTMLVVPLLSHGAAIGALSLLDRRDGRRYGPEHIGRAQLFADLAVLALDSGNRRQNM